MVVYRAMELLTGSARVRGAIDDKKHVAHLRDRHSLRCPSPEDAYTTICAVGTTVEGPILLNVIEERGAFDLSGEDYVHRHQKLTWLNHEPNQNTPTELAMAWINVSLNDRTLFSFVVDLVLTVAFTVRKST